MYPSGFWPRQVHAGWGRSGFTGVGVENNTIIRKELCENKWCGSHFHNCEYAFLTPCSYQANEWQRPGGDCQGRGHQSRQGGNASTALRAVAMPSGERRSRSCALQTRCEPFSDVQFSSVKDTHVLHNRNHGRSTGLCSSCKIDPLYQLNCNPHSPAPQPPGRPTLLGVSIIWRL